MSFTAGTRIGPYEITSPLGEGGMGIVYRAHDTKLGRDVAIKALPDAFANDSDRPQRFQREAQVLASLNHPNIAQIYGLEESDNIRCIVMELVEGQTLQQRLKRGPIPIEEALPIAKQIAEALESAHEKGIIHRDLKPANVKLTPDRKVKVLDFGLAKAFQEQQPTTLSNSPTLVGASVPGVILGTAAYMSPEQARGKDADRSSDIWAFGCVLYEMLTANAAFEGETIGEILAGVFKAEPDWRRLPAETPEAIRRLLRRCLQKDRNRRLNSANDARIEIEEALSAPPEATPPAVMLGRKPSVSWIVASVAAIAFTSIAIVHFREKPVVEAPEMRLEINTPSTSVPTEFALSPDGRFIVFVASGEGPQRLWLRALDKTDARPLPGTEGADYPFWSADSRSIGFSAAGKLKRIDIAGGPPQVLANTIPSRSGTWNADGTIVFSAAFGSLSRIVATSGGEPIPLTRLGPGQVDQRFPQFLPDSRHFIFYVIGTPEASGIYLASLDGGEPKRLTAADTPGAYLVPGMIVSIRESSLMAQRLDLKRGELTGDPVRLADPVTSNGINFGGFSVSADGRVAYRGGETALHQLKWYDRTGKSLGVAGEPYSNYLLYPELSPDGEHVALQRGVQSNTDVWLMDLVRGVMTRFTFDPAIDTAPLWSPDGTRIAFVSARKGRLNLYLKASSGAGAEELLLETPNNKYTQDWSKNGQFLLYAEGDPKNRTGLVGITHDRQ